MQTRQSPDRKVSPDDNEKRDAAREYNPDRQLLPPRHIREVLAHALSLSRAASAARRMDSLEIIAALVRLNDSAIESGERFWADIVSSRSSSSLVQGREIFLSFATIAVRCRRFVTDINTLTENVFQYLAQTSARCRRARGVAWFPDRSRYPGPRINIDRETAPDCDGTRRRALWCLLWMPPPPCLTGSPSRCCL
jgi:hypothetical protein